MSAARWASFRSKDRSGPGFPTAARAPAGRCLTAVTAEHRKAPFITSVATSSSAQDVEAKPSFADAETRIGAYGSRLCLQLESPAPATAQMVRLRRIAADDPARTTFQAGRAAMQGLGAFPYLRDWLSKASFHESGRAPLFPLHNYCATAIVCCEISALSL